MRSVSVPAGGEDDDRDVAAGADRAADVAAVAVGQVEVEQDQVRLELLAPLERLGGGGGDVRLEALARERLANGAEIDCSSSTNRMRGRSRMRPT